MQFLKKLLKGYSKTLCPRKINKYRETCQQRQAQHGYQISDHNLEIPGVPKAKIRMNIWRVMLAERKLQIYHLRLRS